MGKQSKEMENYFETIHKEINRAYKLAEKSKKKGLDPEDKVEIILVENMAERVEGLISVVAPQMKDSGVSKRIKELEEKYGSLDWRVALTIALEVTKEKYCNFKDKIEAMEIGIRTGFAYLTMGIVASPLEGFVNLKIKQRRDGKEYFAINYAGPIRSAGGTGASVSVLIADYIRKNMGYSAYDPDEKEVKRYITELYDYHDRITNLQYLPSEEEIGFLAKRIPVQIDGDGSEKIEVSNFKDLDRVDTNKIRNGVCLTLGEGIAQKAPKVWKQLAKWGKDFGLEEWFFLEEFVTLQKNIKAGKSNKNNGEDKPKILPDYTFIKDLVGGRPIFTHPMREGGFRLRFGRSRTSGYSSYSIHPSTMYILNDYLAIGTQLKNERPGKGCTITVCDSIEAPIVLLKDGSVIRLDNPEKAKEIVKELEKILFLGDILINYGDFFNRAHTLVPPGYCEEWWIQEFEKESNKLLGSIDPEKLSTHLEISKETIQKIIKDPFYKRPSAKEALIISEKLSIPLHPYYTYHWKLLTQEEIKTLNKELKNSKTYEKKIVINYKKETKEILEKIGLPHSLINKEYILIEGEDAEIIKNILIDKDEPEIKTPFKVLEYLEILSKIKIKDKSGLFIGARMGRPEKSKMRHLTGSPQVLFPVGEEGGRLRSFQSALQQKKVTAEFPIYICTSCKKETIYRVCERCNKRTKEAAYCNTCGLVEDEECPHNPYTYRKRELDIKHYFNNSLEKLKMKVYPDLIKGVRGTSNKTHEIENLTKGILRAKHDLFVNKDGTIRYDMTQLPITHFKPNEIGTTIERLKELGYLKDIIGKELTDTNQVLELKPQDVILPKCKDAPEEGAHEVLLRTANFIDELLVKFYDGKSYYKIKKTEDLIGQIVLVLAPHTSGGIAGRIIGFSDTQGLFAHPMLHAATRRDCDGDEACVCLLMDVLLNFSKHYLPAHRGSTQDAPLVLTWLLTPAEVDDMVFDVDIVWKYPLEFYEACENYKKPWDIKLDKIGDYLGKEKQYEGMGFTHPITNLNAGVLCSAYKTLPSMQDKLNGQMKIAENIKAVYESDVARLVIEKHFLKDTKGNLRKFSQQQFRCVACNEKYRRPPLMGKCIKCKGKIIFTISEGSIVKYLGPSLSLAKKYKVPKYLLQTLDILQRRVEGVFGRDKEKQTGLGEWF